MVNPLVGSFNHLRKVKRDLKYGIYDVVRTLSHRHTRDEVINQKEFRIIGLRRTGNHAIINWIRKQHVGEVWHLNNLPVNQHPYRFLYLHYPKQHLQQEAWRNFVKKDCLIYSYEDYSLEQLTAHSIEKRHDFYFGKTAQRYDIVILRDPFNLLASRLKRNMKQVKALHQSIIDLWIEYAKEYLGKTQYFKDNKIVLNYNLWCSDKNYRRQIASQCKFDFSDLGFNEVKSYGGGSSFDGRQFDGKANQMNVLNRWQYFSNDISYRKLLDNDELLEYSEQIFGHIPGTELLRIR